LPRASGRSARRAFAAGGGFANAQTPLPAAFFARRRPAGLARAVLVEKMMRSPVPRALALDAGLSFVF